VSDDGTDALAPGRDRDGRLCSTGLYVIILESEGFDSPPKSVKVMVLND